MWVMSAFNWATFIFYPALGLVALALGLLARSYSNSAFAAGLAGLMALTTASTWMTVAGPVTDTVQIDRLAVENAELKGTLKKLHADIDDARRKASEPSAGKAEEAPPQPPSDEVQRLARELRASQDKIAEAQRASDEAQRKVVELGGNLRQAEEANVEAENAARLLKEELSKVRPAPPSSTPPDPEGIRRKVAAGDRRHYTSQVERDLIPGRRGSWYVVRLLKDGVTWEFADRQFVLADAAEIKKSAARLVEDVLRPLSELKTPWRLYVRGSADARRVTGPTGRELSYLPRTASGTHSPDARGKLVIVPVQNEDLPTLRADWLREIVRPVVAAAGSDEIAILENPPEQAHGKTAELVLHVEW